MIDIAISRLARCKNVACLWHTGMSCLALSRLLCGLAARPLSGVKQTFPAMILLVHALGERRPLLAQSKHALTNVRFWGQSGHDADVHVMSANDP